jgi:hypothetical protein
MNAPSMIHGPDDHGDNRPLLTAVFEGVEILRLEAPLPLGEKLVLPVTTSAPELVLDTRGLRYAYDLSSVLADGARFLHLSISVSDREDDYLVRAHCVLADNANGPRRREGEGAPRAIRFQEFHLPESGIDPNEGAGRGMFHRGFHIRGAITPGNVSHLCICDSCRKSFRLQSFHAGMMDLEYFYCDGGPHTLTASAYDVETPTFDELGTNAARRFDGRLPRCEKCGGKFGYLKPFLCPHCSMPYLDFARFPLDRDVECYGHYLYGDSTQDL